LPRKIEPKQVLRQMQNPRIISKRFEILLWQPSVFNLAYLRLRETKPSPQKLLIERLAKQSKMTGMISVRLEDLADVLTFEGRPKLACLEEPVPEFGRWSAELIAFLPVTPAAQVCGVVSSKDRSAACTATAATGCTARSTSRRAWSAHPIPTKVGVDLPLTSVHARPDCYQRVNVAVLKQALTRRYSITSMEHAELDIDPVATRHDG